MADAPKPEKKEEVKVETSSVDVLKIAKYIFYFSALFLIFLFTYISILQNEKSVIEFIKFLNFLQVILGLYIIFLFYKFYHYVLEHKYWNDKMGDWYVNRYKKPEVISKDLENPNRIRFEKAKAHITSQYKEEWKIGIIELDNILRDLLKQNNYIGETVGDLLTDAGSKGFRSLDIAWEAHRVRNRVVHEGGNFDFGHEEAEKALRKYSEVFTDLGI